MRNKGFLKFVGVVVATSILAACGGGGASFGGTTGSSTGSTTGTTTGTTTTPSATPKHISIVSSSPTINGSDPSTASATITVTVTDANNLTVSGAIVALSASEGALAVTSSTTDTSGNVTATLTQGAAKSGDNITISATTSGLSAATVNVQVTAAPVLQLGTLSGSTFTAGSIAIGQPTLAAGGNSGLTVDIYDTANKVLYTGTASVTFTSPCQSTSASQITSPVATTTGVVNSNYTAKGCSGNDLITATATVGSTTLPTANGTINVSAAALGGLKFISATPNVIGLSGTGQNTNSTVIFQVVDVNGNPVPNATVNFTLSSSVGGITFSPSSAISNFNGNVQTTVNAGTVHTTVQVNATTGTGSNLKASQSNSLVISSGVPTENGLSLSVGALSIEGAALEGTTTQITARLSDRYGNGVPDGTPVSFTAECGHVDASCSTLNSNCSVTYTAQSPRTELLYSQHGNMNHFAATNATNPPDQFALGNDDHRCSIMASAKGEESFVDSIANGLFDATEFFVSLPEAYLDSNENGTFDLPTASIGSDETFIDFNSDATWNSPVSSNFVGLLCNVGSSASPVPGACTGGSALNVFKNIVVVLASGNARLSPTSSAADSNPELNGALSSLPPAFPNQAFVANHTFGVDVLATDTAGQQLPSGTTVSVTSTIGTVTPSVALTVSGYGQSTVMTDTVSGISYPVNVSNVTEFPFQVTLPAAGGATSGVVTITTTTPAATPAGGKTVTFTTFNVQ